MCKNYNLKDKIQKEGKVIGSDIIKVDSFLNHCIDVSLFDGMGQELSEIFKEDKVDKILTVEASGIAVACAAARYMGYPDVVFAKKALPSTMTGEFYGSEAKSFTKGTTSVFRVAKEFINTGENVLIIDDFLANGAAANALADIVEQAGAVVSGIGIAIEKGFQGGRKSLEARGYKVRALATIEKIEDGKIIFK